MYIKGQFIETANHGYLCLGAEAILSVNRLEGIFGSDGNGLKLTWDGCQLYEFIKIT